MSAQNTLLTCDTATYRKLNSCDISRIIGGEKESSMCDIPGIPHVFHWDLGIALPDHCDKAFDQRCVHQSGENGVGADAFIRILDGDILCKLINRSFRGAVGNTRIPS